MTVQDRTVFITRLLSLIFFFSGLSALIYQVVWQRLLATYYGVGPVSIALIVSVYMAGLGLGALYGGYLSERLKQKILAYCLIELCIGLFGIISPDFLQFLGRYTAGSSYALSLIYMITFLFIPTFLMGATLPLLTKVFSLLSKDFFSAVSFLYFVNTIGAAAGALIASYIIISFFGLLVAVYSAAAINFIIAIIVFLALRLIPSNPSMQSEPSDAAAIQYGIGKLVYPLVFVTGFLAIGYEIIWFRVVAVLVKDSPYAFSSVLTVYLTGIAVGSYGMKKFLSRYPDVHAKSLFFSLQFLIGTVVALSLVGYFYLTKYTHIFQLLTAMSFETRVHPGWYFEGGSINGIIGGVFRSFDVFFWSAAFVLVPTLLMGASFPLIASLALVRKDRQGKTVALVYFFTIVGNALAGILTGFVILPLLGTELTVAMFSTVGIAFGFAAHKFGRAEFPMIARGVTVAALIGAIVLFFPRKGELYEVMHASAASGFNAFFEEGVDGTVMTFQRNERVENFINGMPHGGRPGHMFYYETIEAMSRTPKLDSVLVIGFGTGSTVEMLLKSDELKEIVLVELNKTLLTNLRKMPLFAEMLNNPRVHLIIDDGRRYLFNTAKKFDLITTDPLWTSTSYSNNLYSHDFYRLVQQHLNPNGVYLAWQDEHGIVPKTLASVFSYLEMFRDFSIGSDAPMAVNRRRRQQLLDQFSPSDRELILRNAVYLGDRSYVEALTRDYPINREWEPWTEYYLGERFLEWRLRAKQ